MFLLEHILTSNIEDTNAPSAVDEHATRSYSPITIILIGRYRHEFLKENKIKSFTDESDCSRRIALVENLTVTQ